MDSILPRNGASRKPGAVQAKTSKHTGKKKALGKKKPVKKTSKKAKTPRPSKAKVKTKPRVKTKFKAGVKTKVKPGVETETKFEKAQVPEKTVTPKEPSSRRARPRGRRATPSTLGRPRRILPEADVSPEPADTPPPPPLPDAVPVETANTEPEGAAPTPEPAKQTELKRLKALMDRLHFGDD